MGHEKSLTLIKKWCHINILDLNLLEWRAEKFNSRFLCNLNREVQFSISLQSEQRSSVLDFFAIWLLEINNLFTVTIGQSVKRLAIERKRKHWLVLCQLSCWRAGLANERLNVAITEQSNLLNCCSYLQHRRSASFPASSPAPVSSI